MRREFFFLGPFRNARVEARIIDKDDDIGLKLFDVFFTKGNVLQFKAATSLHPREHFNMEKARSLSYTCQFIKSGVLRFFSYDYVNSSEPGLLHDFLYLIEDKSETGFGRDRYQILRDPAGPDDFAQAVNMGTMMLCHMSGQWPNLADYENVSIGEEVKHAVQPPTITDWEGV